MTSLFISGGTIISSSGQSKTDLLIENGVVTEIGSAIRHSQSAILDASGLLIFPGLIDCHVHFREPGLTHKATMKSESASALAGGVTTVCEMPNTVPPTVTVDAFAEKVRLANSIKGIDLRFFFGITERKHIEELRALMADKTLGSRCCGVKLYLDHSTGNQKIDGGIVDEVFAVCAELDLTLVAHCEDAEMNAAASDGLRDSSDIHDHSRMRPPESEAKAVEYAIGKAKKHGTRFHVAHLSTRGGLDHVCAAKKAGLSVTCEVAPHHLFLSTEDYDHLGALGKMNPPLRDREHVDALWEGVRDGSVDCISTDHAPHTLEEKSVQNPLKAPSGVPGVETMLPLLLTALPPEDVLRLCFMNPNNIFRLGKTEIAQGEAVNLIVVDPKAQWTIRAADLHSACGWTPYEGLPVQGKVVRTIS